MNTYIALKLVHVSAIVFWSATLLMLPVLFARHSSDLDEAGWYRLRKRTRLVYLDLASPAAVIAILSGSALVVLAAASVGGWLVLKLLAVGGMVLLHVYFGRLIAKLDQTPQMRSSTAHRVLMIPAAALIVMVIYLVTGKPI